MQNDVDIVDVIGQHVHLRRAGANYKGLCPFHDEKTPSFIVSPQRQRFKCFGCQKGGDAIAFIRELRGLTYKEAIQSLGIGATEAPTRHEIERRERRRRLVDDFETWCRQYHGELAAKYRDLQRRKRQAVTERDVEGLVDLYRAESTWVHRMDILEGEDDEARLELYRRARTHGKAQ